MYRYLTVIQVSINSYMILSLLTTCSNYNTYPQLQNHVNLYLHAKYNLPKSHAKRIAFMFVRPRKFRNNDAWNQVVQAEADIFKSYFVCVENSQGDDKSLSFLRY